MACQRRDLISLPPSSYSDTGDHTSAAFSFPPASRATHPTATAYRNSGTRHPSREAATHAPDTDRLVWIECTVRNRLLSSDLHRSPFPARAAVPLYSPTLLPLIVSG